MLTATTHTETALDKILSIFRKEPENDLLRDNERYFGSFKQTKKLMDCEFCVVDTELTGLSPRSDAIVSIGAVRIKHLSITAESFYTLVAPGRDIPKKSAVIHRITPEMLDSAPDIEEALPEFIRFCGKSLLVGHNIGLDMSFLNRAAKRVMGGKLRTPCLDTMRLAQIYQQELWENYYDRYNSHISYQLGDLSERYGLPNFNQHNALYDAMQTAYLFLYLVKKLNSGGVRTLKDLFEAGRSWRWYM